MTIAWATSWPFLRPLRGLGSSSRTSSSGSSGVPASASASPPARRAATGANRSRPWNVADTGSSRHGECEISTASATPPKRSAAGISRPLSGPTSMRSSSAVRSATARRRAPDLGVDDREVHARRRVGQRPREHQRAGEHGLARDAVGEVDRRAPSGTRARSRRARRRRTRPQPVVGEERDGSRHGPTFSRRPVPRPPVRRACGGRPRGRARGRARAARRSWRGRSRRAACRPAPRRRRSRWRTVEAEVKVT